MTCKACDNTKVSKHDGLCADCYTHFAFYVERKHMFNPRSYAFHAHMAIIDFAQPRVQVAFDEWLELGCP